jgi:hypothetical protein
LDFTGSRTYTVTAQDETTAEYTVTVNVEPPENPQDRVVTIPSLGTGGPGAVLTVPAESAAAVLAIGLGGSPYAGPATPAAITLPEEAAAALENADSITVNFASSEPADVSLAYVHYVREAIKSAKSGITITAVNAGSGTFTPVFDGSDWFANTEHNLYSAYSSASSYSGSNFVTTDGIEIINGIKVFKHTSDSKPMIVYDRDLKVSRLVWQKGKNSTEIDLFHGIGLLRKDISRTISPAVGNWGDMYVGGGSWNGIENIATGPSIDSFSDYETALKEAGLHPSQGVLLNHSYGSVVAAGSGNTNVAENGMYDFILAYYNPDAGGSVVGSDLSASLPSWPASGLAFDGLDLPGGITSRNIGGITAASSDRKASAAGSYGTAGGGYDGQSFQAGEPRVDFVGNLTVPMANYMKSSLSVSSFANTNIIGDGDKWDGLIEVGSGMKNLSLMPTVNIGLIGDYSSISALVANIKGVLDIKGSAPRMPSAHLSNKQGYLNLWNNILQDTEINGFYVVSVKDTGGEKVVGGDSNYTSTIPNVIIYSHKYTNALTSAASTNKPFYRAFIDSRDGNIRITATGLTGDDTKYVGSSTNQLIPSLDESAWIAAGNAGLDKPASDLASNYSVLSSDYKWASAADFGSYAVASAAPAPSSIRLAGGARSAVEAVLPVKKKPRYAG